MKYARPILALLICLYFWNYAGTYTEWHFIDFVNLIFHEAGHAIFFFMGMLIKAMAGSIFQIALPFFISIYFFYTCQKLSGALCLLWVGQNFLNVSVYASDALYMQLDLLGGDAVIHDWNYILNAVGMLQHAKIIGLVFYLAGMALLIAGTCLSLFYAVQKKVLLNH